VTEAPRSDEKNERLEEMERENRRKTLRVLLRSSKQHSYTAVEFLRIAEELGLTDELEEMTGSDMSLTIRLRRAQLQLTELDLPITEHQ
jgi:hypothetical protein